MQKKRRFSIKNSLRTTRYQVLVHDRSRRPLHSGAGNPQYRDLEFLTPAARKRVGMNRFTNRLKIHELSKHDYYYYSIRWTLSAEYFRARPGAPMVRQLGACGQCGQDQIGIRAPSGEKPPPPSHDWRTASFWLELPGFGIRVRAGPSEGPIGGYGALC